MSRTNRSEKTRRNQPGASNITRLAPYARRVEMDFNEPISELLRDQMRLDIEDDIQQAFDHAPYE